MYCSVCKKKLRKGERLAAFAEFKPTDYEWNMAEEFDGFDEIIPEGAEWYLAHWLCMFNK